MIPAQRTFRVYNLGYTEEKQISCSTNKDHDHNLAMSSKGAGPR
jgi:hypothetical protein